MNDRRPYSLLQIRELGYGIHDLPGFDTTNFRLFAVRLDPHETRLRIARSAETLLLVIEGSLTVVSCEETRASTELGEPDTASTNPPAVEALLAGAEGATVLAMVSRKLMSCVMQPVSGRLEESCFKQLTQEAQRCPRQS